MRLLPLCAALLALCCTVPAVFGATAAEPVAEPVAAPAAAQARVRFDFHSGFLMNLHHFLFNLATHPAAVDVLDPADAAALRAPLAFYRARYAGRDLLSDDPMPAIKRALSVPGDARRDPAGLGLPQDLADTLRTAAPVYAAHFWPADDAANRAWIAQAQALDARYGAAVQAAVERGLGAPYPATPVRVDVVVETGKRQGAYTDTQTVMPSGRPSYGGLAALEMLYHEGAHVQSADALEAAIARRLKAGGKSGDSQLWHVLQFHTVGAAVADTLRRDGIAYEPYAEKMGLMRGAWAAFQPLVEADWKPYLAGREGLDEALDRMVAKLS